MQYASLRRAMTLIELLVVMTIIGLLAGAVAIVAPKFSERSRVADAGTQLQGWLNIARQRAQHDKAPRGLRLTGTLPATTTDQDLFNRFAYVEQPEDITGQPAEIVATVPFTPPQQYLTQLQNLRSNYQNQAHAAIQAAITAAHPTEIALKNKLQGYLNAVLGQDGWRYVLPLAGRNLGGVVRAGDVVEFGGARFSVLVDAVPNYPTAADSLLVLHRPRDEFRDFRVNPNTGMVACNTMTMSLPAYRITRAARPTAGEPEMTLPRGVAVDVLYTRPPGQMEKRTLPAIPANSPPGTGTFDILFGPSGEVIGNLASSSKVAFWVRDVSLGEPTFNGQQLRGGLPPGDNRLIVISTRTGNVASHAVNAEADATGRLTDPFKYLREGKASALEE